MIGIGNSYYYLYYLFFIYYFLTHSIFALLFILYYVFIYLIIILINFIFYISYTSFTKDIGKECQVVGDDLLVTNVSRIKEGADRKACNALLLKVNQIG